MSSIGCPLEARREKASVIPERCHSGTTDGLRQDDDEPRFADEPRECPGITSEVVHGNDGRICRPVVITVR